MTFQIHHSNTESMDFKTNNGKGSTSESQYGNLTHDNGTVTNGDTVVQHNFEICENGGNEGVKISNGSRAGAFAAAFTACLDSAALGAVIGYASPAVPDINDHINPFHLNGIEQKSWFVSIIALGWIVGGASAGPLLDRYGRKTIIMINTVPFVVGWLIIAASSNLPSVFIGRFITGICGGVVDVAVPVYLTEVSPADIRGFIGSCYELFVNLGIFYSFGFGIILHYNWLAIVCAILPTATMILMYFMPETPRWLLSHGYKEAAIEVLKKLRGEDANFSNELDEIVENIKASSGNVSWRDFLQPTLYKPLLIVTTLMFVQQFSGYTIVNEFTVSVFASAGINLSPYIMTTIVGFSGVLSNFITAVIVDRTGRRAVLIASAIIMTISMSTVGAFFFVKEKNATFAMANISWLPILGLCMYNFGLNIGFGPIPFYMASELFPLRTRGLTCGISITMLSLFLFLVSRYFMELSIVVHEYGVYWIMAGIAALSIIFVLAIIPETKGKTLEEIEKEFK